MPREIEKFVRVQNPAVSARPGNEWRTIPNCDRLPVWEMLVVDALSADNAVHSRRFIFHVSHAEGIRRGSRVTYLGEHFSVQEVSDSARLRGLELRCQPA